jgi:hypothetical protein
MVRVQYGGYRIVNTSSKKPSGQSNTLSGKHVRQLKIVHNLREGDEIVGIEASFVQLFGKEIQKHLFRKKQDNKD